MIISGACAHDGNPLFGILLHVHTRSYSQQLIPPQFRYRPWGKATYHLSPSIQDAVVTSQHHLTPPQYLPAPNTCFSNSYLYLHDGQYQQRHYMQLYKRQMPRFARLKCPLPIHGCATANTEHTLGISAQLISFASPRFQQLPRYPQRICKIKTQVEEKDKEKKKYKYPVMRGNPASFISIS